MMPADEVMSHTALKCNKHNVTQSGWKISLKTHDPMVTNDINIANNLAFIAKVYGMMPIF